MSSKLKIVVLLMLVALFIPAAAAMVGVHEVQEALNLWGIGAERDTTGEKPISDNNLNSNTTHPGHTLELTGSPDSSEESSEEEKEEATANTYEDQLDDIFLKMANQPNLTVEELKYFNHLNSSKIQPGQTLELSSSSDSSEESSEEEEEEEKDEGTTTEDTYKVQPGDTLSEIANQHNLTVDELMAYNNLSSKNIQPGDTLDLTGSSHYASRGGETPSQEEASEHGEYLCWWDDGVQQLYPREATATVTDVATGLTFQVKRRGGSNHADSEPLTAEDTATLREIYGGSWSWTPRAIIVSVNGRDIAASMNGKPHGGQNIQDNNFPGHICIHFKNSRSHNTNSVSPEHQSRVKEAAGLN